MPSSAATSVPSGNLLRRFRRNRSASAAIEFALVAPVFFGLLFAVIETGIMFFANQVLETITQDSARMLMTGQAQSGQVGVCADPVSGAALPCTQATFQNYVCSQIPALFFTCTGPNGIFVDVEAYPAGFSSIAISSQIDANKNFVNNMQYNPGQPGEVVVVRLFYQWPQIVTGLGYNITNLTGNMRLLSATAVFQNEPY
jgi:Flp pilus assembly protein TadG